MNKAKLASKFSHMRGQMKAYNALQHECVIMLRYLNRELCKVAGKYHGLDEVEDTIWDFDEVENTMRKDGYFD